MKPAMMKKAHIYGYTNTDIDAIIHYILTSSISSTRRYKFSSNKYERHKHSTSKALTAITSATIPAYTSIYPYWGYYMFANELIVDEYGEDTLADLSEMYKYLPICTHVHTLIVKRIDITSKEIQLLSQMLLNNRNIHKLEFMACHFNGRIYLML